MCGRTAVRINVLRDGLLLFSLPSLWELASSAVTGSRKRLRAQVGSIRKLGEFKAEPFPVTQPAHVGFVIRLNSYTS